MKFRIFLILAAFSLGIYSCDEEPVIFDAQGSSQTLVNFATSNANLGIPLSESTSLTVTFNVSATATSERTFNLVIDEEASNVVSGSVTLGTATVAANAYSGTFTITGTDVGLSAGDTRSLVVNFEENSTIVSDGSLSVSVFLVCESNIPEGNWTAPDAGTVTLTRLDGDVYEFSNFNYGYYNPSNNPIRGQFLDICNNLTLQGTTEFGVRWRGSGVYDPVAQTISFPDGVEDANFNPGIFGPPLVFVKQ